MKQDKPILIFKRQDRIDYILNGVSDYYSISKDELIGRCRTPTKFNRKRLTCKLLKDMADCNLKDIMYAFNNKSEAAIWYILDSVNDDMSSKIGDSKQLNDEYKAILKHLNL